MYKKAHIHFVGIGGIGMSGVAAILVKQGHTVSGCDANLDQISIVQLCKLGCTITARDSSSCNADSIDVVVYSSAISLAHEELQRAKQRGIPTIPRALMLAELMRTKYSIAVAGSHGKTTTTSLIAHLLLEADVDPTVIIGGHLTSLATNAVMGNGPILVAETDESDRSIEYLSPTFAVVTTIDEEHVETYQDLNDITQTFLRFLKNVPFYGRAFLCYEDPVIQTMTVPSQLKVTSYGFTPSADWYAQTISLSGNSSTCELFYKDQPCGIVNLPMPGRHNLLNALAAIAVASELKVSLDKIKQALSTFKGVDRRFSFWGRFYGAEWFEDYGHHPNEIKHAFAVAQLRTKNKLRVIFQPHRYSRTHKFWNAFIDTFLSTSIDELIITDIYPAHESPIEGVTSQRLVDAIKEHNPSFAVSYIPFESHCTQLRKSIIKTIHSNDLILILGAGKINKLINFLP